MKLPRGWVETVGCIARKDYENKCFIAIYNDGSFNINGTTYMGSGRGIPISDIAKMVTIYKKIFKRNGDRK